MSCRPTGSLLIVHSLGLIFIRMRLYNWSTFLIKNNFNTYDAVNVNGLSLKSISVSDLACLNRDFIDPKEVNLFRPRFKVFRLSM